VDQALIDAAAKSPQRASCAALTTTQSFIGRPLPDGSNRAEHGLAARLQARHTEQRTWLEVRKLGEQVSHKGFVRR